MNHFTLSRLLMWVTAAEKENFCLWGFKKFLKQERERLQALEAWQMFSKHRLKVNKAQPIRSGGHYICGCSHWKCTHGSHSETEKVRNNKHFFAFTSFTSCFACNSDAVKNVVFTWQRNLKIIFIVMEFTFPLHVWFLQTSKDGSMNTVFPQYSTVPKATKLQKKLKRTSLPPFTKALLPFGITVRPEWWSQVDSSKRVCRIIVHLQWPLVIGSHSRGGLTLLYTWNIPKLTSWHYSSKLSPPCLYIKAPRA